MVTFLQLFLDGPLIEHALLLGLRAGQQERAQVTLGALGLLDLAPGRRRLVALA
jgi:hypothetical protein